MISDFRHVHESLSYENRIITRIIMPLWEIVIRKATEHSTIHIMCTQPIHFLVSRNDQKNIFCTS